MRQQLVRCAHYQGPEWLLQLLAKSCGARHLWDRCCSFRRTVSLLDFQRSSKFQIAVRIASGVLFDYIPRLLVVSQPEEARMPEMVGCCPVRKLNLNNDPWLYPPVILHGLFGQGLASPGTFSFRQIRKRALDGLQLFQSVINGALRRRCK